MGGGSKLLILFVSLILLYLTKTRLFHTRHMSTIKYLTQAEATQMDVELMGEDQGFSVDQLMELAGLSVAQAIVSEFHSETHPKVLVCCGPGNNGGDALVSARHLHHFHFNVSIFYPKRKDVDIYNRLTLQVRLFVCFLRLFSSFFFRSLV